jgi:cytochrome c peroxidase
MTVVLGGTAIAALACQGEKSPVNVDDRPPQIGAVIKSQAATVGTAFVFDASMLGTAFTDPKGGGLTYSFSFSPAANGLASTSPGQVTGIPTGPGIIRVTITARDIAGDQASQTFPVVVFAAGLTTPTLPAQPFGYSDAAFPLPAHFKVDPGQIGPATGTDNTPASNPTTDAGATLGRVLFYDKRLSVNDGVACASCHQQAFGFSDTARLSRGFAGGTTKRHAMGLANARFYQLGRFFWDERAATLEDQVLQPIQDPTEMGMSLPDLVLKLEVTEYYPALFQSAFGSPEVTSDRISKALAQFVRSLVSTGSRFDSVFDANGVPDFSKLTSEERAGRDLFFGPPGCHACHATNASVSDAPHNTGLDATITDIGAGSGRFKAPSLRNVAVRPPYMHDGRFQTLAQVVEFYDTGVQLAPGIDSRLRVSGPAPKRLNLTQVQRDALVAYLRTLTDPVMLTSVRFANPF